MNSLKKSLTKIFLILGLCLLSFLSKGQDCHAAYQNALNHYNKAQFDYVFKLMEGCLAEINKQEMDIGSNRNMIFHVYKLVIESYKNIEDDNSAEEKTKELAGLYGLNREQVLEQLNQIKL